jgi:putative membrane protein
MAFPRVARYPLALLLVYLGFWAWLAVEPHDRTVWLAENMLVFVTVPTLVLTWRRFPYSDVAYTCMFVFLALHAIGGHYTYPEVPGGDILPGVRNDFDRVVHFAFGLLISIPARELLTRLTKLERAWSYYFPLEMTIALAALFEILEWAAASLSEPGAGAAYLGAQGDPFDAVKDVGLAALGALITMGTLAVARRFGIRAPKPPAVD